jgi:hypothetical protein
MVLSEEGEEARIIETQHRPGPKDIPYSIPEDQ